MGGKANQCTVTPLVKIRDVLHNEDDLYDVADTENDY